MPELTPFDLSLLPPGTQVSMTGDDWTSDRDKKHRAKVEAARKKAALACAKKLEAAADALHEFSMACLECNDASSPRRDDDGRTLLQRNMREYSSYLEGVFGKDGA